MSGIVGSRLNIRGSGVVGKLGTDGQVLTSSGAGASAVYEAAAGGGGKLLKTATGSFTTSMNTNADAGNSNAWVVFETLTSFTPSSSNSDIVVTLVISTGQAKITDGDWSFRLVVGGTTVDWRMVAASAPSDAQYSTGFGPAAFRGVYDNTATNALTITFDRLIHGSVTGDEKVRINTYGKTAWWTVEEWDTA